MVDDFVAKQRASLRSGKTNLNKASDEGPPGASSGLGNSGKGKGENTSPDEDPGSR